MAIGPVQLIVLGFVKPDFKAENPHLTGRCSCDVPLHRPEQHVEDIDPLVVVADDVHGDDVGQVEAPVAGRLLLERGSH